MCPPTSFRLGESIAALDRGGAEGRASLPIIIRGQSVALPGLIHLSLDLYTHTRTQKKKKKKRKRKKTKKSNESGRKTKGKVPQPTAYRCVCRGDKVNINTSKLLQRIETASTTANILQIPTTTTTTTTKTASEASSDIRKEAEGFVKLATMGDNDNNDHHHKRELYRSLSSVTLRFDPDDDDDISSNEK